MYKTVLIWPSLQEICPQKGPNTRFSLCTCGCREGRNEMRHLGAYQLEKRGI